MDSVILELSDFGDQQLALDPNFSKLRDKMRKSLKQAFSMNFDLVYTFKKSSANKLHSPSDVKISYNNDCIVVGNRGDCNIIFFNYTTKLYMTSFKPAKLFYCFLIENGEYQDNDYFIINDEYSTMSKYHLATLIDHCKNGTNCDTLWENNTLSSPYGMTIRREKNKKTNDVAENWIYVSNCGTNSIVVVKAATGTKVMDIKFGQPTLSQPYGIEFIVGDSMLIVSEYNNRRCSILKQDENGDWQVDKTIQTGHITGEDFDCPLGIAYDKIGRRIFVCDQYKSAIRILNEQGQIIGAYKGGSGNISMGRPFGITFDERKGELYVTHFSANEVRIYR
ncbi:hypothetical protein C9374_012653 [Naegleria lovaniensis]|uniref:NHL repeat-containing protein n=1 Tax=Naegleria lovaniensis TaxID=51637 RepID=A0AA88H1L9_NAELO|nr:uncharacterized protein C9374_012653 [Naegleria lovaniensis]KAG2392401.1 hypothetical protein C9374_012653 [Naegleria lovaniensis]